MLNFSRTPTRLDTSPSLQKAICIFCMFWTIVFTISVPTVVISNINQDYSIASNDTIQPLLLKKHKIKNLYFSQIEETISNAKETSVRTALSILTELHLHLRTLLPIPMELYLHPENTLNSYFYWVPVVLEERMSEDDILIDLSSVINPELAYELSDYYTYITSLIVERESGNQPFIGQLLVAEDVVSRIRSGIYGSDIDAILMRYLATKEPDGRLHVYLGSKEIVEASPSVQEAVKLALGGSQVSYYLLKATTELRNEQYNLNLDDTYYKWGALFHFAPNRILDDPIALRNRRLSKIPVSFQYCEHIFYGHWLSDSAQLNL